MIAACPRKFHLREATTRQTARIRKACAAVLFWHQKSTQKSAAVPHAADPRASRGAPAGAAVFPWHVRRSGLANAKSVAFAFTASRALPFARRPPWAGESSRFARRQQPPPHPNGPAKAGPWQNLNLSHASKALQQAPAQTPQGGLGAKPPLWNPVRGPRNVERTYGQFAVRERAANASLFAVGVRGRRSEGV